MTTIAYQDSVPEIRCYYDLRGIDFFTEDDETPGTDCGDFDVEDEIYIV